MQVIYLQQGNAIFHHHQSLKKLIDFHDLDYALADMHVLFFLYCKVYVRY